MDTIQDVKGRFSIQDVKERWLLRVPDKMSNLEEGNRSESDQI